VIGNDELENFFTFCVIYTRDQWTMQSFLYSTNFMLMQVPVLDTKNGVFYVSAS
jgi:hypothetical protein